MYRIARILLVITLLSLPATSLADSTSDLLGAPTSSSLQTGSPVQSAPQTSTLQPEPAFIDQSPADSASTLQGQTPSDQETLLVENDGTPSPLPTSSSSLEWWVIGIIVVAGLSYYWFGFLLRPKRSVILQLQPESQPASPVEAEQQLPPTKPKVQPKKKPSKNKSNGAQRKKAKKRSK